MSAVSNHHACGQSLLSGLTVRNDNNGVAVFEIRHDSYAKKAGIQRGDVIFDIGGRKIKGIDDYVQYSRRAADSATDAASELSVSVLRNGIVRSFLINNYSVPIKEFWNENAPYSEEITPGDSTPFDYWISMARRRIESVKDRDPYEQKIAAYRKAINYAYYALHHNPKMVMAVVMVADVHNSIGNLLMDNGLKSKAAYNYKRSITLYGKAMTRTDIPKADLIEIRNNLQNMENALRG